MAAVSMGETLVKGKEEEEGDGGGDDDDLRNN